MPVYSLRGGREMNHAKGESYKAAVRRHLTAAGWTIESDSSSSGGSADLIARSDRSQEECWIEAKNTELSLRNADFAEELLGYFQAWLGREPPQRFLVRLYAAKLVAKAKWEAVLQKYDDAETSAWLEWLSSKFPDAIKDEAAFRTFLGNVDVFEGGPEDLVLSASKEDQRELEAWRRIGEDHLQRARRQDRPLAKKSTLLTNTVKLNPPTTVYTYHTEFQDLDEIQAHFRGYPIPPFKLDRGGRIRSFEEPLEHNPFLGEATEVSEESFESISQRDPFKAQMLLQLHIERIIGAHGLEPGMRRSWYLPIPEGQEVANLPLDRHRNAKMSRLMIHQDDTDYHKKGDVNYGLHEAIAPRIMQLGQDWYMVLDMHREYTDDGGSLIEDGEARDRIDRKLRTNVQSRNAARSGQLTKWLQALFTVPPEGFAELPIADQERYHWIKKLNHEGLTQVEIPWTPEAADRSVPALEDFQ